MVKADADVFYTRKGVFIVTRRDNGKETSNKYETAAEAKAAVAGLLAQGCKVWWAPRASAAAYGTLTPKPTKEGHIRLIRNYGEAIE
jgi:hypothetical protein